MILLGLNAALGNRDCGELEHRHLELDRGWLTYARNKTGIARRAFLWPETVDAIRLAIAHRPDPAERRHSGRVFLTIRGAPFAKETTRTSPVSAEFAKALGRHAVAPGRGFYALRHTFRTVADGCGDTTAVRHIMGHVDHSIDGQYRETIADARLRDVSEYVREWFLADGPAAG
jgi:integrase